MFKEIFIRLCNQKKESPSAVCKKIGITPATYSCWNEKSIPRKATLQRIADYFNVTTDYLLGKESMSAITLSNEEQRLVLAYREHDESTKKAIRKLLDIEELTNRAIDSDSKTELLTDVSKAFTKTTS